MPTNWYVTPQSSRLSGICKHYDLVRLWIRSTGVGVPMGIEDAQVRSLKYMRNSEEPYDRTNQITPLRSI